MFLIVEGPDLSGKSTLSKSLAQQLDYTLVKWPYTKEILNKCPDESGETFLRTLLLFKNANIVMDRGLISNFVYSELFKRDYNNEYIYEIAKQIRPTIVVLLPPIEAIKNRRLRRSEDFIDIDKLDELYSLYEKHTKRLMSLGWNIKILSDSSSLEVESLKFLNTRSYLEKSFTSLEQAGKETQIYSNHHKKFLSTNELIFTRLSQDLTFEESVFDKDYEHLLPRINEVAELLKQYPTHRGAVILNPKAEYGDCICLWQFLIRENMLYCSVYIRSSDIDRKMIADVQMTRWLIDEVAEKVGITSIGPTTIMQGSAHTYLDK